MQIYLVIHGRPHVSGERIKEFRHRPDIEPGLYVWQDRALSLAEHTTSARLVAERFPQYRPYTRLIPSPITAPAAPGARVAELEDALLLKDREIASRNEKLELQSASLKQLRNLLTPPQRRRYEAKLASPS